MNTKLKKQKKNTKKINISNSELKLEELTGNECFICLELLNNNETVIKLNESAYYNKICDCNGWVHNFCLNKWYSIAYICPICRKTIFSQPVNQNIIIINNDDVRNSGLYFIILVISKINKKILLLTAISILYYTFFIKKQYSEKGYAY
jgi:hypothetical protein